MSGTGKHIVIIGGGGFIGLGLRKRLQSPENNVSIIGRSLHTELLDNESFYSVSEYSYKELAPAINSRPIDIIIDLAYASVPNTSYADPVTDFSENLRNVILHLDFAVAVKAGKYIYVSSGGTVYGDAPEKHPFKETDANYPLSPYGITKLACERYVYMYHRLHGLPALIARPANVYGPGQLPFRGQGLIATCMGLAMQGKPVHVFGDGAHVRDYVYIDDCCSAIIRLMESGANGGIYNIGSGKGISIEELITYIDHTIRKDGIILQKNRMPERPFDVHYNVLDINKIEALHHWQPETGITEGLAQTWTWIQNYMKISRL